MNWDLTKLYKSFDDPKLTSDIDTFFDDVKAAEQLLCGEKTAEKLEAIINAMSAIAEKSSRFSLFVELTLACDSENANALKFYDKVMRAIMADHSLTSKITAFVGSIDNLQELVNSSRILKEHEFFIMSMKNEFEHLIDPRLEPTVLEMQMTGGRAWSVLRDQLDSGLMINVEGEEKALPLSAVRGMAYSKDADVRKKAYEAEIAAYPGVETAMAACLNGIKGEALTMMKLKRFDSILDNSLFISNMDNETLESMLTAMRESLPDFRRYFRLKAKALGYEGGLKFYDLFAPLGASDKVYSIEEAREFLADTMRNFSDEMADHINQAFEEKWIDAFPHEGKQGGAFCADAHVLKQSYVLTNYDGSLSSISTIAHELGHAYHNRQQKDGSILLATSPMPLAETASIFNETLLNRILMKNASSNDEKLLLLDQAIGDAAQVIVDILSRFMFEAEVIERRKDATLTANELKKIMIEAQLATYGDGLDPNYLHPYMWACKGHYYSPGYHFYNFPYAFGQLFGLGVYKLYEKEGEAFIPKYNKLLASTGKDNVYNVGLSVGIDVHDINFWRASLDVIREQIKEMEKIVG